MRRRSLSSQLRHSRSCSAVTSARPICVSVRCPRLDYLLRLLGCKTAVAFGGVTGLRVAQLFQPHIVFLDLDMPGQCLTGRSEPEDERCCLEAGFDRFMTKPIEPNVLEDLLAEAGARSVKGLPSA